MSEDSKKTVVSSWNEWDPLKHVIVGRADGTMVQAPEPAVERDWPEYGFPLGKYGPLPKEMEEKANEQLDNFAKVLEGRGIRVDRPTPLDFSQTVQTPDWRQETMFGCMPPRDLLLTIGNEILEATMSLRSRWFEYLCYRPLLEQYYKEDPNMRWEAAPKPRLTDRTYKKDYWKEFNAMSKEEQLERTKAKDWVLIEVEPLFDAADVGRFGKDLFVQQSTVTNGAGIDWVRRHFPGHRIHTVIFKEESPMHIDATKAPLSYCSVWLSMNLLMLDPKTVCVEASETAQMEQLDKLGFEVIPIPFWDVAAFGGGLHCATADVYREGTCGDYFPKQVEGF